MPRKTLGRRGLDRRAHRQMTRYQNLLLIIGAVAIAAAAAGALALLAGHLFNGAIAA